MALTDKLTSIANAIREKTSTSDRLTLDAMPTAIRGIKSGSTIPDKALHLKNISLNYYDMYGTWDWFIEANGNQITTENIQSAESAFWDSNLVEIPFDINFDSNIDNHPISGMFAASDNLVEAPALINVKPLNTSSLFSGCDRLQSIKPSVIDWSVADAVTDEWACDMGSMFRSCRNLREIPREWLYCPPMVYSGCSPYYMGFEECRSLSELTELPLPTQQSWYEDAFVDVVYRCERLKEFTFKHYDQAFDWSNQYINLANVGTKVVLYDSYLWDFYGYKEIKTAEDYAALKNDADWWTEKPEFSRYNHTSAVNTINSLPTVTGESNIIDFGTNCATRGSATDGGAIGNLTEEEIAIATSKGWTVTYS